MSTSKFDYTAVDIDPQNEGSSGNKPPEEVLTKSCADAPEVMILNPETTLKNIELFDITSDKQYIAIVDSEYMLHVYKITGNFEAYEEMSVFKIYSNEEEEYRDPSRIYPESSAKGIWICNEKIFSSFSLMYICLSISYNGRFVALSISTSDKQPILNIYSTDNEESRRKFSKRMNKNSKDLKNFQHVRPVFLNDIFILVTNTRIYVFNQKLEKISSIEAELSLNFFWPAFLHNYASCNFITDKLHYLDDTQEITSKKLDKLDMNGFFVVLVLAYLTSLTKHNIIMEMCEDDMNRIWLPESNELIASITNDSDDKILAISENNKYIATSQSETPEFKIKSLIHGSVLHEIKLDTNLFQKYHTETRHIGVVIDYASFQYNDKYLFISGYVFQEHSTSDRFSREKRKQMSEDESAFCELWNIPAQRMICHKEFKLRTNILRKPIIFIDRETSEQLFGTYICINNSDILETESFDIPLRDTTENQHQQISIGFDWKEWSLSERDDSFKNEPMKSIFKNDQFYNLYNTGHHFKRYILSYNNNTYILLFGYFSVQMYRVRPSRVVKSTIDWSKDTEYRYFSNRHELIYIKIYDKELAGTHRLIDTDEADTINIDDIQVVFDVNGFPGRTFVTWKQHTGTSETNSNADDHFEELFLPMELVTQHTSENDIFERSINQNKGGESSSVNTQATKQNNSSEVKGKSKSVNRRNVLPTQNNEDVNKGLMEDYEGVEYHNFESTIRALYYFESIRLIKYVDISVLNGQASKLLKGLIKKYEHTNYFSTESGSFSLYILSSISKLHPCIENIILIKDENQTKGKTQMRISIFSYPETNDTLSIRNSTNVPIKAKEYNEPKVNVFTELSRTNRKLFYLLFYRVLMDSKLYGVGNMVAVTDLFLFLQREKYLDILLKCTEMMAYFPLSRHSPIRFEDIKNAFNSTFLKQYKTNVLSSSLTKGIERQQLYELKSKFPTLQLWSNTVFNGFRFLIKNTLKIFKEDVKLKENDATLFYTDEIVTDTRTLCLVPLPYFNSHTPKQHSGTFSNGLSIFQFTDSPFTKIASSKTFNNLFVESNINIEVLTLYKWSSFAGKRFILILFVHAVYYVAFSIGVAFAPEVFGYSPGEAMSHPGHYVTLIIMFLSWFILVVQELRQFMYNIAAYMSFYNLIDWSALIMPIVSFVLLRSNGKHINEVTSTTTLVLWIHAILRLRAFETFGTTLELIIQMSLKTLPFIGAFCSVVIAFTHTLIVLLREKSDDFFQEQYSGTLNDDSPQNSSFNGVKITLSDSSSQNDFKNPFKAFADVWFFIYGVWDPLNDGDAGDDPMVTIFSILFSFIMGLIFFNMIIALMSSTIEKINERGRKNWIHHLAAVVSEVELFWATSSERSNEVNNPRFVYYITDKESYEDHKKRLSKEYEEYLQLYCQERKKKYL